MLKASVAGDFLWLESFAYTVTHNLLESGPVLRSVSLLNPDLTTTASAREADTAIDRLSWTSRKMTHVASCDDLEFLLVFNSFF